MHTPYGYSPGGVCARGALRGLLPAVTTSESLGQRSANRGECAQACRLPYTLVVDGKAVPLGERRYLLKPAGSVRP